ncbi:hypothetical protein P3X46_021505 [Hevea brasiliensis]|uniref:Myb-like domain-containing protein n=1 Tax=Hevea brasiliensis TaxID=3981 RepID=A0ABQ9LFS7_HEVBR|nr:trihelix transcription factor DF1 [Hevea brasiliensis]KAJ9166807.1 hypothetical protein P3X46_021505 [Hevea brasiliensis]
MQGDSNTVPATSGVVDVATATMVHEDGEVGGGGGGAPNSSGEEDKSIIRVDEGDRMSYGANRWPRQETLALLKIRSDMDAVFRDSSLKGPLWEEVSRKLAELGYHRSAKKCKEKFENVYKYHKRTKEGRTGKSEGKTYRFFDQLQALENHHHHQSQLATPARPPSLPKLQPPITTTATLPWSNNLPNVSHAAVPSTTNTANIIASHQNNNVAPSADPAINAMPLSSSQPLNPSQNIFPSFQNLTSHLFSSSTSSSTASDEGYQTTRKRKRSKWKDFLERLTKDVMKKQEELQRKFLETVEKREHERMACEEAWRMQEMARINREHEILIQERTTAAAKDAAVIAFLQKISGQQNSIQTVDIPPPPPPPVVAAAPASAPAPPQSPGPALAPAAAPPQPRPAPPPSLPVVMNLDVSKKDNGQNNAVVSSSSRWPKVEVQALINLRTNLDTKYQENGPKGPLWEEISAGMQKLGYNRSAKRCKEKWENINKYFKKVKESSKNRSEDSKTCPYFHQLDVLYKEKSKTNESSANNGDHASVHPITTMEPLMVRPEQQWPLQHENQSEKLMDHDDDIEEDDDNDGETEEEDEGGGRGCFEVVASKPAASVGNGE